MSAESFDCLRRLVRSGRARSLAPAVRYAVARVRQVESRRLLEESTAAYFARLHAKKTGGSTERAAEEEKALEAALAGVGAGGNSCQAWGCAFRVIEDRKSQIPSRFRLPSGR